MMIFGVYLLIRRLAVLRYIRCLRAGYRLPISKYTGILTQFQRKVNKKLAERHKKKLATNFHESTRIYLTTDCTPLEKDNARF